MLIIVTGAIGAGKTTVCRKVVDIVRGKGWMCGGVISEKTPEGSILVEDVQTGATMALAGEGERYVGPRTPRYSFNPAAIVFANEALERGAGLSLLVVDELGRLELRGEGFVRANELVKAGRTRNSLAVVRKELLADMLALLGGSPVVFETTRGTRDELPLRIAAALGLGALNGQSGGSATEP